jgi:hypothetical protein
LVSSEDLLQSAQNKLDTSGLDDLKGAPRQVFRGWVIWHARGPGNGVYFLEGSPDSNTSVWKVDLNGQGLLRTTESIPMLYNFNYERTNTYNQFDVSPDGRHLAFQTQRVLEENIGMIENIQ